MTFDNTFKIALTSYAKINLGLSVPFRYPNGYHHIVSIFAPIDLADEITFFVTPPLANKMANSGVAAGDDFKLTWENLLPSMFQNEAVNRAFTEEYKNNLMYKAWVWFMKFINERGVFLPPTMYHVHIRKKIPSPAGLGGGSSNAACIIVALFNYLRQYLESTGVFNQNQWAALQADLQKHCIEPGADIPFFVDLLLNKPQASLISGTGEVYGNLPGLKISGILGIPPFGFSTPGMYQAMEKPVLEISEEGAQAQEYVQGRSKKSLHCDNYIICNLYSIHANYLSLYEMLCKDSPARRLDKEGDPGQIIDIEENKAYFLKNEFIGISEKLYPDKFLVIENMRKAAAGRISPCTQGGSFKGKRISSMSGSGASVFAGICGADGSNRQLRQRLEESVAALKKEFPQAHWLVFSTMT